MSYFRSLKLFFLKLVFISEVIFLSEVTFHLRIYFYWPDFFLTSLKLVFISEMLFISEVHFDLWIFFCCMGFFLNLRSCFLERAQLVLDHDFLPTNYLGWCHGNWSKTKLRLFVFKTLVKIFGPKPNGKLWSQFMTWQVNKTLGPKPSGVQNQINHSIQL